MNPPNAHGSALFGLCPKVFRRALTCALFVTLATAVLADEPPEVDDLRAGMKARLTAVRQGLVRYTTTYRNLPLDRLEDAKEFQREVARYVARALRLRRRALKPGEDAKGAIVDRVTRMKLGYELTAKHLLAWDGAMVHREQDVVRNPALYYRPREERNYFWYVYDMQSAVLYREKSSQEFPSAQVYPSQGAGWDMADDDHPLRWPELTNSPDPDDFDLEAGPAEERFGHTAWWMRCVVGKRTYRILVAPQLSYMSLECQLLHEDTAARSTIKVERTAESNGVHFPTRFTYSRFDEGGSFAGDRTTDVQELVLNSPPDDDLFKAILPAGTRVDDFYFGPPANFTLAEDWHVERRTADERKQVKLAWAVLAALVLVVLAVALVLAHNRERAG